MSACRQIQEGSVATNKSCDKADFDWARYKKPARRLTDKQMEALSTGHLRPLLDYTRENPDVRVDIRPAGANLYYDGGSLLQFEGGTRSPFRGVYNLGYVGEKGMHVAELPDAASVQQLIASFPERRKEMWRHRHSGHGRDERRNQQLIARANDGRSPTEASDFVVVDIEYANARRVFDLVAFDRAELPRPRLVLIELKCRGAALSNNAGLQDHAIDFCEFLRAEEGRHVELAQRELTIMVQQKVELGLISADLGFEEFSGESPEFLVLFADYDVCQAQLTLPLSRLLTEIKERLGSLELLRFADLQQVDEERLDLLRLSRDHLMNSAAFDAYRERTR